MCPSVKTEFWPNTNKKGVWEFPGGVNALVQGLTKSGTGHPPAESGFKTKELNGRHNRDFSYEY